MIFDFLASFEFQVNVRTMNQKWQILFSKLEDNFDERYHLND
jgi:hypothetical protein